MSPGKRKRKSPSKDKFVDRVIEYFQGTVPDWPLYMLSTLIIGALKSLRHYMESEDAPDANWENPFAELQFPARWDWKANQIIFIDAFNQKAAEEREEAFIDSVFDYHIAQVFWAITNGAMLYKEGQDLIPILEQEVWDVIHSMPEDDGKEKLAELYQPFVIGCIPVPVEERSDNIHFGSDHEGLRKRLEDIPKLRFASEVGGNIISGTMMFVFQPLMVNADEHRAYSSILAGLVFDDPDAALLMSQSEQGEFWGRLLQQCDYICSSLLPDKSDEGTEFHSVVLQGIDKGLLPIYEPWIIGVHGSALASLREKGELPALRLPQYVEPKEPDQRDSSTAAEEEGRRKAKLPVPFQPTQIETRQGVTHEPERLQIFDNGFFAIHRKDGEERKFRFRRNTKKFEALRYMAIEAINGNRFPDKYDVATMCDIALDKYNPRERSLRSWFVSGGGDPERFAKRFMKSDRKGGCEILIDPGLIEIYQYEDYSDDDEEQGG